MKVERPLAQKHIRKKLPMGIGAVVVFTRGSEKGRQFPLVYERTLVGRTQGDILIKDLGVSSKHLAIDYRRGKFHIVDAQSKNGTYINNRKIADHHILIEQPIRIGDSLFHIELDVDRSKALIEQQTFHTGPQKGLKNLLQDEFFALSLEQTIPKITIPKLQVEKHIKVRVTLSSGKDIKLKYLTSRIYIGREDSQLILQDIEVSRKHAYLERMESNQVVVFDLASANGTFVNDKRIAQKVLSKNDIIRVGKTRITFLGVF